MSLCCVAIPHSKEAWMFNCVFLLDAGAKAWQSIGTEGITLGNRPAPLNDGIALLAQRPRVNPKSSLTSASVVVIEKGNRVTWIWVWILFLSCTSWATLDLLFIFSESQFAHLYNGNTSGYLSQGGFLKSKRDTAHKEFAYLVQHHGRETIMQHNTHSPKKKVG